MAYPTVNAPYGLKPINLYGGTPFAGATRQYKIASGYNTSIFYGDVVEMINDGTIIKSAITSARATVTTSQVIGVFLGCSYVNAQGQTISLSTSQLTQQRPLAQLLPLSCVMTPTRCSKLLSLLVLQLTMLLPACCLLLQPSTQLLVQT